MSDFDAMRRLVPLLTAGALLAAMPAAAQPGKSAGGSTVVGPAGGGAASAASADSAVSADGMAGTSAAAETGYTLSKPTTKAVKHVTKAGAGAACPTGTAAVPVDPAHPRGAHHCVANPRSMMD